MFKSSCCFAVSCLVGLAGCALNDPRRGLPVVQEAWISESVPENVDSVAAWRTPEGKVLVLATAKDSDTVRVYDAHTGRFLRHIGKSGSAPGEFGRPNGIAVVDNLAFVVEHDNHRVQVVALDTQQFLGSFGADELRSPYGLWIWRQGEGRYRVFVTDSYYTQGDRLPADEELGERVKVFDVSHADGRVAATLANRFGDTQGAGVLRTVESIWGDVAHNRVLVADENETRLDVKIYDLDGRFTGTLIGSGLFKREPEGIALIECGADGDGYWLISDQHTPRQIFRLFDRRTLAYVGSFAPGAAHTVDGVWFHPAPFDDFPSGALFVQHADAAVAAFDWMAIVDALSLRRDCGG